MLPKPPNKKGVTITFPYKGVVRKAIIALKYKFASDISDELSDLVKESFIKNYVNFPKKATLIPIPLHIKKEKFRGFNQVKEVGKLLAKKMDWDYLPDFLVRSIPTKNQADLGREERFLNVKGVFGINPKGNSSLNKNIPIILFDDVYTTGSTMNEAAKILKSEGFKKIYPLVIAG